MFLAIIFFYAELQVNVAINCNIPITKCRSPTNSIFVTPIKNRTTTKHSHTWVMHGKLINALLEYKFEIMLKHKFNLHSANPEKGYTHPDPLQELLIKA